MNKNQISKKLFKILLCTYINCIYSIFQPLVLDKYEHYNRSAFNLNYSFDQTLVRPTAVVYNKVLPGFIRTAINNVFNNLNDITSLCNDIFQLDFNKSIKGLMRVSINTVFGILGIVDISTDLNLPQQKNTFGNTLKRYGWTTSSYFMIPFLGPSTIRDAVGVFPDIVLNVTWWVIPFQYIYVSFSLYGLNLINKRAHYLQYDEVLDVSLDPYVSVRDAYLGSIGASLPMTDNHNNKFDIDSLLNDK